MRILVSGAKDFHDASTVYAALNKVHDKRTVDCLVIHSWTGADYLAMDWARDNGIDICICNKRPKNGEPDAAVVFGSTDITGKLKERGLPVWEVRIADRNS